MVSTFQEDFSVEDKPRSGQPKKFEDKELKITRRRSESNARGACRLGITQQVVSVGLRATGMNQKQGNWVPYKLKPRDVEGDFSLANS